MKKSRTFQILKNIFVTAFFLLTAFLICLPIYHVGHNNSSAAICIFILAILMISRFTNHWLYGTAASAISVFAVNYAYTYPFFALDFSLTDYPLTFVTMLLVSVMVNMTATNIKHNAKIRAQVETGKMKVSLLRSISHDIRTPLTSILGSASTYMDNHNKLSEQEKTLLVSDIRDDAQWLTRIIENVLSITKISNPAAFFKKNPEIVEEFVGEAVQKFKKNYPNINVKVSVPKNVLFVSVDVTLIEQVIINILQNAVTHGRTTTVITVCVTEHAKRAHFSIADNGVGIDRDILPKIFNATSVHIQHETSDITRDIGIGLSVCKSIITAHGGKMRARNRRNGGAVFEFTLPVEKNI